MGISLELLVHRAAQGMHMQCTDLSTREVFGCSGLAGDNRTSMVPVALGSGVVSGEAQLSDCNWGHRARVAAVRDSSGL